MNLLALIKIVGAQRLILPIVEGVAAKLVSDGRDATIDTALADRATSDELASKLGIKTDNGKEALFAIFQAIDKIVEAEGI